MRLDREIDNVMFFKQPAAMLWQVVFVFTSAVVGELGGH